MHVSLLSRHLARLGHGIIPICYPDSPLTKDLRAFGFAPHELKVEGYFNPQAVITLSRWLAEWKADLVHSHFSRDLWTIVPALKLDGSLAETPLVLTKHIGTQKHKRDLLHRWIYRRVNYLIAISQVIRNNLIATHPLSPDQVGVVHHGVDLDEFSPHNIDASAVRAELGFSEADLVFGIIGRLQFSKGYVEFLEMARRLKAELPQARFLMVGEASRGENEEAEIILKKVQQFDLAEVTRHVGFRQDVPRLLAAMDVFVFPSRAEAFGMVLIEAMAMGKPVISSNCDGVLDIVQDGVTGLLVPPRDVESLTESAFRLARDSSLRAKFKTAGRTRVVEFFSIQRMLASIERVYTQTMSRH